MIARRSQRGREHTGLTLWNLVSISGAICKGHDVTRFLKLQQRRACASRLSKFCCFCKRSATWDHCVYLLISMYFCYSHLFFFFYLFFLFIYLFSILWWALAWGRSAVETPQHLAYSSLRRRKYFLLFLLTICICRHNVLTTWHIPMCGSSRSLSRH